MGDSTTPHVHYTLIVVDRFQELFVKTKDAWKERYKDCTVLFWLREAGVLPSVVW